MQNMQVTRFHFQRSHPDNVAFRVPNQVQCHPFDEEAGFGLDILLVQRVQHGVAGAVSGSAGALDCFLAVVGRMAAKGALINCAIRIAVKWHAHVFKVIDDLGCFTAHELDGVLITQPVRTFDGVVKMVVPVVIVHVSQRGTDASLRSHRVGAGGEYLAQNCNVQTGAGQLQGSTHAGATGPDDDDVEFSCCNGIGHGLGLNNSMDQRRHRTWTAQPAHPTSQTIAKTWSDSRTDKGLT